MLALKRDALSRASALRLFVAQIPPMVRRGDAAAALSELKLHLGHVAGLRELRASFIACAPSISLPPLDHVERQLHADLVRGLEAYCGSMASVVASAGRDGWRGAAEHAKMLVNGRALLASHTEKGKEGHGVSSAEFEGGAGGEGVLGMLARARGLVLAQQLVAEGGGEYEQVEGWVMMPTFMQQA